MQAGTGRESAARDRIVRSITRLRGLALAIVFVIASALALSNLARAGVGDATCGLAGNWMSMACIHDGTQTRVYAEWDNRNMYMTPTAVASGGTVIHILNTASGSPCNSAYVDVGLKYGGTAGNNYEWFVAATDINGNYFDLYGPAIPAVDLSHHKYEIFYVGPNSPDGRGSYQTGVDTVGSPTGATWSHRFDYQGFGSCLSRVGVDSNRAPSSDWYTDAFSATALAWRDLSSVTRPGWNTSEYWIEDPCGSAPTCLNGLYYGASRWDSNKP